MSHKGNKLIKIIDGTQVDIAPNKVTIKGPQGQLTVDYPANLIKVEKVDKDIKVSRVNDEKQTKMYHGTVNANIANAIVGVNTGFKKTLKIVGVGYKAAVTNGKLVLAMGFSHPVEFAIPQGLKVTCPSAIQIDIQGFDKVLVGEFAANVRKVRKPEPYKGKGIMYENEHIIRKVGKTAEATATAAPKK
ncbi:MAG: 50S ribosomal protein L6 [Mycoplasmoidaceae bacterium]|nr:50S ribosomal protein L6 [Mycoplasmoidaceae bacterium]